MLDVVLPLGVLAIMLAFAAQVRRLISHAILNRTIRKALEVDPPSARLLIQELEPFPRWPDALAGWILAVAGLSLGAAAIFGSETKRSETLELAVVGAIIGLGIIAYACRVERATPHS